MFKFTQCTSSAVAAIKLWTFLVVASVGSAAFAADRAFEGSIVSFACGDNCYLTIKDSKGKRTEALCVAPQCQPWNQFTEIPEAYIGKKVKVKIGTANQYDGAGKVRGKMDAFNEVFFLGD